MYKCISFYDALQLCSMILFFFFPVVGEICLSLLIIGWKVSYTSTFSYSAILLYDYFLGQTILYSHSWLSNRSEKKMLSWDTCIFVIYRLQQKDKYIGNQSRRLERTLENEYICKKKTICRLSVLTSKNYTMRSYDSNIKRNIVW